MYHGFLYDPDGRVVDIPGQEQIPTQARLKSYPVADRHSWLWVWMGDPAKADIALIPDAVGFDNPNFVLGHGNLDYNAQGALICDNLLDFSHLSYLHPTSFGATESWALTRPAVIQLDRGVRIQRWFVNEPPMRVSPDQSRIDRWQTYDFMIPGVLLMTGGTFPVGTAEKLQFAEPDLATAKAGVTFTSQAVTPLTEDKSRYFFSWGPRCDLGGEDLRNILMGVARKAFDEDKVMIEAQQRVYEDTLSPRVMPTTSDKAVVLFNRLVERMARAEMEPETVAA